MTNLLQNPRRLDGDAARRAASYTVFFRGASKLTSIVVLVLLVRLLTPDAYGAYHIYYAIFGFVATIISLGIPNTLTRFLPEYHAKHNDRLAHKLFRVGALASFAANVAALSLLWFSWDYVVEKLQLGGFGDVLWIFAAVLITRIQSNLLHITLSAYLLHQYSLGARLIFTVFKLLGYATLTVTGVATLKSVFVIDLVGYVIMYVSMRIAYSNRIPTKENKTNVHTGLERRRVFRYSIFYNFNDFGQFAVGTSIDNLILAAIIDPVAVGAYAFVRRLEEASTGFLPIKFFQDTIRPLFFTLDSANQREQVNAYFHVLTKLSYVTLLPLCTFFVLAYESLSISFLDGKFHEYTTLVAVIFSFTLVTAFDKPLMMVVQLEERAGAILISKLFGFYNVLALLFLVPLWGVIGAAIATGTTLVFSRIFLWWSVRNVITWAGFTPFVIYCVLFWATAYALGHTLLLAFSNPTIALFAAILIVSLSFFVFIRGPVLNKADSETLLCVLRPREKLILKKIGLVREVFQSSDKE